MVYYYSAPSILLITTILMTSLKYALFCRDCDNALKREIDNFYDFHQPRDSLEAVGPCSFQGNSIAKSKRSVFTQEQWISESSSCPWENYIDEDVLGIRYPCRLYSARLTLRTSSPQRCLRRPGLLSRRSSNQFCEPLLQNVPVMVKTGCHHGCYRYERQNVTIAVGYTCVMHPY